jgi:hypothetical protein
MASSWKLCSLVHCLPHPSPPPLHTSKRTTRRLILVLSAFSKQLYVRFSSPTTHYTQKHTHRPNTHTHTHTHRPNTHTHTHTHTHSGPGKLYMLHTHTHTHMHTHTHTYTHTRTYTHTHSGPGNLFSLVMGAAPSNKEHFELNAVIAKQRIVHYYTIFKNKAFFEKQIPVLRNTTH